MRLVDRVGEQLLELVDDDDDVVPRGTTPRTTSSSERVGAAQRVHDVGQGGGGDAGQRRAELLERIAAGCHLGDEPGLRTIDGAVVAARGRDRP